MCRIANKEHLPLTYLELRRVSSIRHITVIHPSMAVPYIFWINYKRSKIQLVNVIMRSPSSEISTSYQSKLVLTTRCQHFAIPSSHPLPLSSYQILFLSCLLLDSSIPPLSPIILCIPAVRTSKFGQRSFSYAARAVWDAFPREVRHMHSQSPTSFKTALKTRLFRTYYVQTPFFVLTGPSLLLAEVMVCAWCVDGS